MANDLIITPGTRGALRIIIALAIAYLFVVALMTAAAQQHVNERLQAADGSAKIDYSTALVRVKESEALQQRVKGLQDGEDKLNSQVRAATNYSADLKAAMDDAWSQFAPLADRVASIKGCRIPEFLTGDVRTQVGRWNAVLDCRDSGILETKLASQVEAARIATGNFGEAERNWQAADRALTEAGGVLQTRIQEVDAKSKLVDQAASLRLDFGELGVLRHSWLLGGGFLVDFPPSLMQIVLAFVSGAFGALLITLVLIVYPQSQMGLTTSPDYEARLFLGGLISVCVYIVLGGGSAVLGNTSTFNASQANFMTFTAVGILAGMFSDRVAFWLSDRATAFFARSPASIVTRPAPVVPATPLPPPSPPPPPRL